MEARFIREKGDLACKLMAAMQGSKMVGADNRCTIYGTSSLSSFLRVAKSNDLANQLYIDLSVPKTPQGYDPTDSLQIKFDKLHNCKMITGFEPPREEKWDVRILENGSLTIYVKHSLTKTYNISLYSLVGQKVQEKICSGNGEMLILPDHPAGVYLYSVTNESGIQVTGKLSIR